MPYEAIGVSLSQDKFLKMLPPKPLNLDERDKAIKDFYGQDPIYISYDQNYDEFIAGQQNFDAFKVQYMSLIESFRKWCKANLSDLNIEIRMPGHLQPISKIDHNVDCLIGNLLTSDPNIIGAYVGSDPQACFLEMKQQMEMIHFMLYSDGISPEMKKMGVRDLLENNKLTVCAPGVAEYISDLARTLGRGGGALVYDTKFKVLQDLASSYSAEIIISRAKQESLRTKTPLRLPIPMGGHVHCVNKLLNEVGVDYGIPYIQDHYAEGVLLTPAEINNFKKMASERLQIISFLPRFDDFGVALVNEAVVRLNKANDKQILPIFEEISKKLQELGDDPDFSIMDFFLDVDSIEDSESKELRTIFTAKPTAELLGVLHATILSRLIQSKQIDINADLSKEVTHWLPMSDAPFTVAIVSTKSKPSIRSPVGADSGSSDSDTADFLEGPSLESANSATVAEAKIGAIIKVTSLSFTDYSENIKQLIQQKKYAELATYLGITSTSENARKEWLEPLAMELRSLNYAPKAFVDNLHSIALLSRESPLLATRVTESLLTGQALGEVISKTTDSSGMTALNKLAISQSVQSQIEKILQNSDANINLDDVVKFVEQQPIGERPMYLNLLRIKNIIEADPKTAVAKLCAVLNLIEPADRRWFNPEQCADKWREFLKNNDLHISSLIQTEDIVSSNRLGGYINLPFPSSEQVAAFYLAVKPEDWLVLLFKDLNNHINLFEHLSRDDTFKLLKKLILQIIGKRDQLLEIADTKPDDQEAIKQRFYGIIFNIVRKIRHNLDSESHWKCIKFIKKEIGNDAFAETIKDAGDYHTLELFFNISSEHWDELSNSLITEKSKEYNGGILKKFFSNMGSYLGIEGDVFAQFLNVVISKMSDSNLKLIFENIDIENIILVFDKLNINDKGQKTDRQRNTQNYLFALLFEGKIKAGIENLSQIFKLAPLLSKQAQLKLIDSVMPDILAKMDANRVTSYFNNVNYFNEFIKRFDKVNRLQVFNALATKFPLSAILSSPEGKKNFNKFINLFPDSEKRNAARLYSSSANPIGGWDSGQPLIDNIKQILLPHSGSWMLLRSTDRAKEIAIIEKLKDHNEDPEKIISVLKSELDNIDKTQRTMSFSDLEMRLMCCIDNISKLKPAVSPDISVAADVTVVSYVQQHRY